MDLTEEARVFTTLLYETIQNDMSVTTMTVGISLAHEHEFLNLDEIATAVMEPSQTLADFMNQVIGGPVIYNKNKRSFNNSIILKLPTKQSVKIFCNGTLHITGFKKVQDAVEMADMFTVLMELALGRSGINQDFRISGFDVQLINACFCPPCFKDQKINLTTLQKYLKEKSMFYSTYNTDRHAGVMVKAPEFTLLIFESANIIITSVKAPHQLRLAYDYINPFLETHHDMLIQDQTITNVKSTKKFDYSSYVVLK
jgi:TATA-box binding protein (TBP) (component of TFIID and TFIIIB)